MTDERFHRAVYVISVAAELAGMHPQTLRIYERKGLLAPARTAGGSRRYSDADLALLERIAGLTDSGLNLVGVQRVLELEREIAELRAQLSEARQAHEDHLAELVARGFNPGSRLPAIRSKGPVTLYRARREPAQEAERSEAPGPERPASAARVSGQHPRAARERSEQERETRDPGAVPGTDPRHRG